MNKEQQLANLLSQLEHKYNKTGQDMMAYLEGLLHANYLNYWDYVNVDTLLTLQQPETDIPDELIFIIYHQITELYFKLILSEMEQLTIAPELNATFFAKRLKRMNAYFKNLTHSFEIMIEGMEKEQFLKFRMSLLPASGFQSAQYRMIEICATDMIKLVDKDHRNKFNSNSSINEMFEFIYWKAGATELASGKKTLTLTQFEDKYTTQLIDLANKYQSLNLWRLYQNLGESDKKNPELLNELRNFDTHVNVKWPLVHYKSAARYLQKAPEDIAATGGTNWQKYLPPRFQKRIFFPELWSEKEMEEWGKMAFVD